MAADALEGPSPSTEQTADLPARAADHTGLAAEERRLAGSAFHFAFGAGLGATYGLLVEHIPLASAALGIPFGAAQMPVTDWLSAPWLGLSQPPTPVPASAHLLSLTTRVVYGVTTELTRRAVRDRL